MDSELSAGLYSHLRIEVALGVNRSNTQVVIVLSKKKVFALYLKYILLLHVTHLALDVINPFLSITLGLIARCIDNIVLYRYRYSLLAYRYIYVKMLR